MLAAWGLVVLAGALSASRLRLHLSFKELLPGGDPTAAALDEVERRMGDLSTLVVAIRSPSPTHSLAYAADLAPRIRALGPRLVERALYRAPDVYDYFERNRWLYADTALLEDAVARLHYEIDRRKNPLLVTLDEPPPLAELERRRGGLRDTVARFRGGDFSTEDGRLVAIVILPGSAASEPGGGNEDRLVAAVKRLLAEHPPESVHPEMRVWLAGEVASSYEERRAIQADVALTTVAVLVLVSLVVGLYFGRLWAVPLMALPAMAGAIVALGIGSVVFGSLNSSTAFLGGIIIGNGINYPILLLARYDEERRAGRHAGYALDRAVVMTARPTAMAAFAASVAYGSLVLTRFRGFSQFGLIGASGMALCWLATMSLLPSLVWLRDGRRAHAAPLRRANFGRPFASVARRAPIAVVVAGALVTLVSAAVLPRWLADPFDYDFRHLRRVEARDSTNKSLDGLFGRTLSPSLVMADSHAEADAARTAVREQSARLAPDPVAHAITIDQLLPGTPDEQRHKLALLDEMRRLLEPRRLALLDDADRRRAAAWRPPAGLRELGQPDLPELLRRAFTERDGSIGRMVYIYPPDKDFSSWNGHDLFRLSSAIREVRLPGGKVLHGAGRSVIFAAMIEAIGEDGPRATLASLLGVSLLALVLSRLRPSAFVILGALCLGVLWMLGVAALTNLKLNFLNFVALPITFGIGIDYAANVWLRYRQEGAGTMTAVLRSTGGAVMLNSATTIIGYASLLVAHSRALRSFGALAILGELACVSAALLVLPSLIELRDRRRHAVEVGSVPAW